MNRVNSVKATYVSGVDNCRADFVLEDLIVNINYIGITIIIVCLTYLISQHYPALVVTQRP